MAIYKLELREELAPGQELLREYKFKKESEASMKVLELNKELQEGKRKYKLILTKIIITKEVILNYESN